MVLFTPPVNSMVKFTPPKVSVVDIEKLPPTKIVRAEPGLLTTPFVLIKSPAEVQLLLKVVALSTEVRTLLITTELNVTVPQVSVEASLFVPSIVRVITPLGKRFPE